MVNCSRPLVKDLRIESVVASVDPLGNPEHDQMNQQRQLIARPRTPWKSVGTPTSLAGPMCGQQIYLAVLRCTLPCQAIDHPPREFLDTIYVSWFTKLFTEVVVFFFSSSLFFFIGNHQLNVFHVALYYFFASFIIGCAILTACKSFVDGMHRLLFVIFLL